MRQMTVKQKKELDQVCNSHKRRVGVLVTIGPTHAEKSGVCLSQNLHKAAEKGKTDDVKVKIQIQLINA